MTTRDVTSGDILQRSTFDSPLSFGAVTVLHGLPAGNTELLFYTDEGYTCYIGYVLYRLAPLLPAPPRLPAAPQLTTSAEAESLSSAAIIGIGVGAFVLCVGCVVWLLCLSRLRPRSPTAGTAQRAAGEQGALVLAASKI